jgi:hypothetical protein
MNSINITSKSNKEKPKTKKLSTQLKKLIRKLKMRKFSMMMKREVKRIKKIHLMKCVKQGQALELK